MLNGLTCTSARHCERCHLCGDRWAAKWDDIALSGEAKQDWIATFLDLPNDIPSHDTFNRVFAALERDQFRAGFVSWGQTILPSQPPQVIAPDGETVRGSSRSLSRENRYPHGQRSGQG